MPRAQVAFCLNVQADATGAKKDELEADVAKVKAAQGEQTRSADALAGVL